MLYNKNNENVHQDSPLAQRGIAQAAQVMGWQNLANGWKYPIRRLNGAIATWRYKHLKGQAKYTWDSVLKKQGCDYYFPPQLEKAIQNAKGLLYLAAGEIDLLTYMEAGFPNVLSWFGENSVPKTLLKDLQELGVSRVIYAPDNDAAGRESANKVRAALRGSAIDLEILDISEYVETKGDTNDLWQALNFDAPLFRRTLAELPALALPEVSQKPQIRVNLNWDHSTFQNSQDQLKAANLSRLAEVGMLTNRHSNGWQLSICPCHEDSRPSASIHLDSGVLHCFAKGQSYSPVQVADFIGIHWRDFYPAKQWSKARNSQQEVEIDEIPMAQWAWTVALPFFSADETVDEEYISKIDLSKLNKSTILIKSPLGTGKTEFIKHLVAAWDKKLGCAAKVLIITNKVALVDNLAERLKELHFETYAQVTQGMRVPFTRVISTIDSLHTIETAKFDLVISDENETNLPILASSGTMNSEQLSRAYEAFKLHVQKAEQFVALDAHLSDKSRAIIEAWRGAVYAIENTHRPKRSQLTFHRQQEAVIAHAHAKAQENKGTVVITTNSKQQSYLYYAFFKAQFGEQAVKLINGDNSASADNRAFLKNINDNISRLRVLIVTPSLQNGFDIQTKVAGVFGVFLSHMPANDILQMLLRCRKAASYHVYVAPLFNGTAETDYRQILRRQLQQAAGTAQVADFVDYKLELATETQKSLSKIAALFQAERNRQRNDLFSFTVAYAQAEGFEIAYDESPAPQMRDTLRALTIAQSQQKRHDTLSLAALTTEAFHALQRAGKVSPTEKHQHLRYLIETSAGQAINESLYDFLESKGDRADFQRFLDLLDTPEALAEKDRLEAREVLARRQHHSKVRQLISSTLVAVFGESWLHNAESLSETEITQRFANWLETHRGDVLTYLDGRHDLSTEPLAIFRRILKRCKLQLASKQVRQGNGRIYVYWLNQENLAYLQKIAQTALAARHNQAVSKPEYLISNSKRNLRQATNNNTLESESLIKRHVFVSKNPPERSVNLPD